MKRLKIWLAIGAVLSLCFNAYAGDWADGEVITEDELNNPVLDAVTLEGATDNTYETELAVVDPTADRTITFPNTDLDFTNGFDPGGAIDIDYGSADITDHTFVSDGGTVILDGSVTLTTGDHIVVGTTTLTSVDELDGTKIKDADYGDVTISAAGVWDVENAQTVTTNANLTGPITSVGNATSIAAQTGTGSTFVVNTSPTLVTPILGVATATSINKVAFTQPATASTLTIADGATLTVNGSATITNGTHSGTNTGDNTVATSGDSATAFFSTGEIADAQISDTLTSSTCTGNAATVSNATLTTALTVDTGTVGLTGNGANTSVLTLGAGASSISGDNTGDAAEANNLETLCTGIATTEIYVGNAANDGIYTALSGDVTMDNTGDVTVSTAAACTGQAATVATITGLAPDTQNTYSRTQYLIPYASSTTAWGQIAIGDATQVLTSNGASAAPTFQAAPGGGDDFNGFLIGTDGDYTTVQAALNAQNSGGEQFYISEGGTYTEAVTFTADNQSIIGLGNAENTIITQAAADVVNFSTMSGCTLANVTVSLTAADGATDNCIVSANDSVSDYNTIKDCIIKWTATGALSTTYAISLTDGNLDIDHNKFIVTNTYAGTTLSEVVAIDIGVAGTVRVTNNDIDVNNSCTGTAVVSSYILEQAGASSVAYIIGNTMSYTAASAATSTSPDFMYNAGTAYIYNNKITVTNSGTATTDGINSASGTFYASGNVFNITNADGDGKWLSGGTTSYATGNIVIGDDEYTAATNAYVGGNIVGGDFIVGGGDDLVTATEVGAMFWDGIVIGTDNDNNILDDSTHGAGVGTLYLGNATVDATFTGFHYYRLGDTGLQAGECVSLIDGKLYRTTTAKDKTAIGIYCGLTNWKDSLGNSLVDGKLIDKEYEEWDAVKEKYVKKTKKVKDYGQSVGKSGLSVQPSDYAYSVAVIGDSRHENETAPLAGAWVTVDAGTIQNGDYLCSSDRPGYLEKQSDDVRHNYTVAEAKEDVTKDTSTAYIYLLQ